MLKSHRFLLFDRKVNQFLVDNHFGLWCVSRLIEEEFFATLQSFRLGPRHWCLTEIYGCLFSFSPYISFCHWRDSNPGPSDYGTQSPSQQESATIPTAPPCHPQKWMVRRRVSIMAYPFDMSRKEVMLKSHRFLLFDRRLNQFLVDNQFLVCGVSAAELKKNFCHIKGSIPGFGWKMPKNGKSFMSTQKAMGRVPTHSHKIPTPKHYY